MKLIKGSGAALVLVCALVAASGEAWGDSITFTVEPGQTATRDDAWKASALSGSPGSAHFEEDFESYSDRQQVDSLSMGGVTVSISTNGVPGAEIFRSAWFGYPDVVYSKGLLNWTASRRVTGPVTFAFSGDDVHAFGVWVFDDGNVAADKFTLTAVTADGSTATSGFLDVNPGSTQMQVEGFLGVEATGRLTSVTVTNFTTYHAGYMSFEMDHLQLVASKSSVVPEPTSVALLGLGLAGAAAVRRRRSAEAGV